MAFLKIPGYSDRIAPQEHGFAVQHSLAVLQRLTRL